MSVRAFAAFTCDTPFRPTSIERRAVGSRDVEIAIVYCGICHTDLHQVRDWTNTNFPCVPGHEIVGRVTSVGNDVSRFKAGDVVGVGCMVDSCRTCGACREGLEQFCKNGFTGTYNAPTADPPGYTMGGYSQQIVVDEDYVLRISHSEKQLAGVAPLLCAGITTFSPFRHWGVAPGKAVGIVGIGGLGHVGIKIAHAMGAHVVAFTTSESKRADAKRLGADEVVVSSNADEMTARIETLDFILNTVSASHALDPFVALLKRDCSMAMVGVPNTPHTPPDTRTLFRRRRSLTGSLIGGIAETQEMLDFCARHDIVADIEMIRPDEIDASFDRLLKNDVKYRFVIDMAAQA